MSPNTACTATIKGGSRCSKNAFIDGFCKIHRPTKKMMPSALVGLKVSRVIEYVPSTTALATVPKENLSNPAKIDSESLGQFVRDGVIGVAEKLIELKPYIEELFRRIDQGEMILGCSTRKDFCQRVLKRTPRAIRYMLDGGNHNRGETVSPVKPQAPEPQPPTAMPVIDAEFADVPNDKPTRAPEPQPSPAALTVKELMDWWSHAPEFNDGRFEMSTTYGEDAKVDLTILTLDPATAKALAEYYLRLKKETAHENSKR